MPSSDTILGGIAQAIDNATSGWAVEIGFNTDVNTWITSKRSTGRTILVTFDSDLPVSFGEGGKVRSYAMSLSVWMRTVADAKKFLSEIWPTYKAMRAALDGLSVTEDGKRYRVSIGAGSPSVALGFAVAALQLTVQKG